ncbi:hypothetical protein L0F63_000231, partial [Massospora cicadina]
LELPSHALVEFRTPDNPSFAPSCLYLTPASGLLTVSFLSHDAHGLLHTAAIFQTLFGWHQRLLRYPKRL